MGPHFYQSGLHIATLPHPEAEQVAEMLPEVKNLTFKKSSFHC